MSNISRALNAQVHPYPSSDNTADAIFKLSHARFLHELLREMRLIEIIFPAWLSIYDEAARKAKAESRFVCVGRGAYMPIPRGRACE